MAICKSSQKVPLGRSDVALDNVQAVGGLACRAIGQDHHICIVFDQPKSTADFLSMASQVVVKHLLEHGCMFRNVSGGENTLQEIENFLGCVVGAVNCLFCFAWYKSQAQSGILFFFHFWFSSSVCCVAL